MTWLCYSHEERERECVCVCVKRWTLTSRQENICISLLCNLCYTLWLSDLDLWPSSLTSSSRKIWLQSDIWEHFCFIFFSYFIMFEFYYYWGIEQQWGAGVVICLERGADLHMAQLMPLPLTISCSSKIQIGYTCLVPDHLGSPGQRAVKRVCVWGIEHCVMK